MNRGSLLHVGCGSDPRPDWINQYTETRLDINPDCNPDIIASMTDLGDIGQFDALLCQHALEHLSPHEVSAALNEFKRVLHHGGTAFIIVPDLEDVRATEEVLLESPAGQITGLDMIYGYRPALKENPHMAHKTGFVKETMEHALEQAGFAKTYVHRLGNYNLLGVGVK